MSQIVTGPRDILATWLCERIGLTPTMHIQTIGLVRDGQIIAVVGFDGWNGASLQMHVAAAEGGWITRPMLRAVFGYAFGTCGAKMVMGLVPSGNIEAVRLNEHLGFTKKLELKDAHPDGSLILMTMTKDECRWLKRQEEVAHG